MNVTINHKIMVLRNFYTHDDPSHRDLKQVTISINVSHYTKYSKMNIRKCNNTYLRVTYIHYNMYVCLSISFYSGSVCQINVHSFLDLSSLYKSKSVRTIIDHMIRNPRKMIYRYEHLRSENDSLSVRQLVHLDKTVLFFFHALRLSRISHYRIRTLNL